METEAAFHRKLREEFLNEKDHAEVHHQFFDDIGWGLIELLPLATTIIDRVSDAFLHLPANVLLRAGDAIHLATAAEAGFKEIYSNDRHLLTAASLFKLKGINPLAK